MDILDFERTVNPAWWLKQIADCDWTAGQFLHALLAEERFHVYCGENARLFLLTDGPKLVSFCTCAEKDEIPETELAPWMGFAYTCPEYRGRRLMGKLISCVTEAARDDGYDAFYISTGETGLYEKYGAGFLTVLKNNRGTDSRIYRMETYGFYGHGDSGAVRARAADYPGIETPKDLYRALWKLWSRETCTPRMRKDWTEENRTLGQCAITAFLAQDIFGGRVWGIPLEGGGFHCFNAAEGRVFDLTSEQFRGQPLDYSLRYEQFRHVHFQREEKRERYETLKSALKAALDREKGK